MPRRADAARARESARAEASAFRRRWGWRDRVVVMVAGWAAATLLRLLDATLRVRLVDPAGVLAAHRGGDRVLFAAWHDGIVLLPLAVLRSAAGLRPRVMPSWHRDAAAAVRGPAAPA